MDLTKTGKLIAQLRREKGLTQKNVADSLGICAKTVSKWETGHGFPDVSLISGLSQIFQVDVTKLLEGEMPQIKPEVPRNGQANAVNGDKFIHNLRFSLLTG